MPNVRRHICDFRDCEGRIEIRRNDRPRVRTWTASPTMPPRMNLKVRAPAFAFAPVLPNHARARRHPIIWQVGGDEQTLSAPKRYMTLPSPSVRNPMRADLAKNIFKERGEKVTRRLALLAAR